MHCPSSLAALLLLSCPELTDRAPLSAADSPSRAPQSSARAWDSCGKTGPGSFQCLGLFSSEFLSLKSLLWCKREKSGLLLAFHPQTAGGWMLQQFSSARGSPECHKQMKLKHPRTTAQVCRGSWEFAQPTCYVLIISA